MLNEYHHELESDDEDNATSKNKSLGPTLDIYVKNFDRDFNDENLVNLFSGYGTITDCKIARDRHNHSKGYGFISFSQPFMAENAVASLNNLKLINGKKLRVRLFRKKHNHSKEQGEAYETSYMNILYQSRNDSNVNEDLPKHNKIKNPMFATETGRSQRCASMSHSTDDKTREALNNNDGQALASESALVATKKSSSRHQVSAFDRYRNNNPSTRTRRSSSLSDGISRITTKIHSMFKDHESPYETNANQSMRRQNSSLSFSNIAFDNNINNPQNGESSKRNGESEV